MASAVAVDSWAFLEVALGRSRGPEVGGLVDEADRAFTTREVAVETSSAILRHTRSGAIAWAWLQDLVESRVRVYEPPLEEVRSWAASRERGNLSLVDLSLAYCATRERTKVVATEDAEFRRVGLDPVFAAR
jgi:predicted nucleic acid-binding protein